MVMNKPVAAFPPLISIACLHCSPGYVIRYIACVSGEGGADVLPYSIYDMSKSPTIESTKLAMAYAFDSRIWSPS